ncbi:uncharacterized protein [Lepidochelys kempii]|uniref:uncharacterized protein n=1 Tax=Lepidochelys kempii TaxID=8472 RepID=UPI003C6F2162
MSSRGLTPHTRTLLRKQRLNWRKCWSQAKGISRLWKPGGLLVSSARSAWQADSALVTVQISSSEVTMESQNSTRAPAWTEQEILDLIAVWGDESVLSELSSKRRNAKIFEKISKSMKDRGYHKDPQQCHVKLKELRQAYQKTQEANACSGSEPQTCRFYDELHAILGGAPTTTPHLYVDSCKEVSHNRDEDFGDKEDDSAHQASGETVLPDSQELFITLKTLPSQPVLPNLEGEKGPLLQMFQCCH